MRRMLAVLAGLAVLSGVAACKTESGERKAGCDNKQSIVHRKYTDPDSGHLVLAVQCGPDISSRWYVSWDDPEKDRGAWDSYTVGSNYP